MAERRVAVVTGGSSGIGAEIARELARRHHDLVVVARSESRLRELARELSAAHGVSCGVLALDLSTPGSADTLMERLKQAGVEPEVLVNNAGVGYRGRLAEQEPERLERLLQLNIMALTTLTRRCLPGMLARGRGRILNLASTAAFAPGPLMAVYYASKAYVLSFSQAIASEVKDRGVVVTALCPGPTRTEFATRAGDQDSRAFRGRNVMNAADVARAGVDGLFRGETVVVPGAINRMLVESARVLPRGLITRITHRFQERKG